MSLELEPHGGDPAFPLKFAPVFQRMQGAQVIATYVNMFLYGIGTFIVIQYYNKYTKSDHWIVKLVVGTLWILATLETCFSTHQAYNTVVRNWGKIDALDEIIPSTPGAWGCLYLTAFVAQTFLGSRIWKIGTSCTSPWKFMAIPVVFCAFLQLAGGFMIVGLMIQAGTYPNLSTKVRISTIGNGIHSGAAALSDICITIGLIALFRAQSSLVVSKKSKTVLQKIAIVFINRALATSILAVTSILLYHFASGTYYFLIPLLANTHVYMISVVAILTSRESRRKDMNRSMHMSDMVFDIQVNTNGGNSQLRGESTTDPSSTAEGFDLQLHKIGPESSLAEKA